MWNCLSASFSCISWRTKPLPGSSGVQKIRHRRRGWRRIQFSTKVKMLRKNYTEMRWIKEGSSPISLKFDRNRRVRGLNEKKILISSKAAKVKMPERQTKLTASCYFLMKEFKKKKINTQVCVLLIYVRTSIPERNESTLQFPSSPKSFLASLIFNLSQFLSFRFTLASLLCIVFAICYPIQHLPTSRLQKH